MSQSPPISPEETSAPPVSINLLLLCTGSVAAIKTGLLLDELATEHCHIRMAASKSAFHFLTRAQPSRTGVPLSSILTDEHEWNAWQDMNDTVVHIELRQWADMVVIVPMDANTLAKIAGGLCDNLISSVMRAWYMRVKPVILCPAMNTIMWEHPVTAAHINQLRSWFMKKAPVNSSDSNSNRNRKTAVTKPQEDADSERLAELASGGSGRTHAGRSACSHGVSGEKDAVINSSSSPLVLPATLDEAMFQVVGPVSKKLACGDVGMGGMASVAAIARVIRHTMGLIRAQKAATLATSV